MIKTGIHSHFTLGRACVTYHVTYLRKTPEIETLVMHPPVMLPVLSARQKITIEEKRFFGKWIVWGNASKDDLQRAHRQNMQILFHISPIFRSSALASLRKNPQLQINKKDWQSKSKMKVPMNLHPSCSNYSPPFLRLIDQTQLNIFLGSYNCICQYNFDLKLDLKVICSFEVITYKVIISSSFLSTHSKFHPSR